jgi:hypothetical protein
MSAKAKDEGKGQSNQLSELMKAHLDDVTGGLAARHNQWRQVV